MFSRFGESPDIAEVYHGENLAWRVMPALRRALPLSSWTKTQLRWLQSGRNFIGKCSGDDAYGLSGGGRDKFLYGGDHELRLIKMNPVLAVLCNYLLDIGADAAQA